jgi:hypothetical protein
LKNSKTILFVFLIFEIILGLQGGYIYIITPSYTIEALTDSNIYSYWVLNLIFFGITILLGVTCSIVLKNTGKLFVPIILSLATGIVFFLIHVFILKGYIFSFLSLFGFIAGFNFYLFRDNYFKPRVTNNGS